jgi:hypothetical protein
MANAVSEENAVRAANEVFYRALSAGSIKGISAACAHDSDVTALHETSTEVAVGWQAVLDSFCAGFGVPLAGYTPPPDTILAYDPMARLRRLG